MYSNQSLGTLTLCAGIISGCAVAQELPPGVPNPRNPDGTLSDAITFTTEAYAREAFRLILQEADQVARDLRLPEDLPITEKSVVRTYIPPFGYAYVTKSLGNLTTQKYNYGVLRGNKFSQLCITGLEEHCFEYQAKCQVPIQEVDTNRAYCLATQWLAAVKIDVKALGRCECHLKPNELWNGIAPGAKLEKGTFVPIYDVYWTSPNAKGLGIVASVQLFTPTKTLLQMSVYESQYILRQPLQVTNLNVLLAQPAEKKSDGGSTR